MAAYIAKKVKNAFGFGNSDEYYKILLIGETGSGKTSFLNFLWNCGFVLELGFEGALDKFRNFNAIELENPKSSPMESKTSDARMYPNVKLAGGLTVGIIDTPGFGDSRGMDEDKLHSQRIVSTLKTAEYINCICLVINGSMARMSATLKYVLSEVTAILPREVLNNVIVVFTNIADPLDLNFQPSELRRFLGKEVEQDRIFLINNPYCRVEKAKMKQGKLNHTMIARSLKKSFDEAKDMLTDMCAVIKEFKRVHTHHFVTLYETKLKVDGEVTDLLMAYENQMEIAKKITKAEKEAEAALETKNLHADYRSTQTISRWIRKDTTYHNTLCRASGCFHNCHVGCSLPKSFDWRTFKRCGAMGGNDYCTECGHHFSDHYHGDSLHELKVEEKDLIDEKGMKKFEAARSMEERARVVKDELSREKAKVEKAKKDLSGQLLLTMEKFQMLGVTRNYTRVLRNQLAVVEHRLEGDDGDQFADLKKTKEEIETKLQLVEETLKEPWSRDADPISRKTWACTVLGVQFAASTEEIERAFREKARGSHPDKPGGDDEHFQRVLRAKEVLITDN